MTMGGIFAAADWAITLSFFEYRGHAKGYHFYFAEVLALGLLIGTALEDWKGFRFLPPGLWLYFFYCLASFVSIVNAPEPKLVLMAAFKYIKFALFFVAGYNFLKREENVRFLVDMLAVTMAWQFGVVVKMKYWDGMYQVPGTFEHQNSLSMYVTMVGLVLLAASLGVTGNRAKWYLAAFVASAFVQQSTLSRAGLAIFAAGTMAVIVLSCVDRITKQRLAVLGVLVIVGSVGLVMTMDTIIGRFQDRSNEASNRTREFLNRASRDMVDDFPLGIGWNNFGVVINRPFTYGDIIDQYEREGGVRVDASHQKGLVESHYYLLLAETGYQGLAAYLVFIVVFLFRNVRAALFFRNSFLGSLSLGIGAGCGFNYIHALLERVLTQPRNLMLWMLLLAATARIEMWRRQKRLKQLQALEIEEEKLQPV